MHSENRLAYATERIFSHRWRTTADENWFKELTPADQERSRQRAQEKAREWAQGLLNAIDNRDAIALRDRLQTRNSVSRRIFTELTGVKLGKSNKATIVNIRDYVGHDKYDTAAVEVERQAAERRAKEEADIAARKADMVLTGKVKYSIDDAPEKVGTRREFIDDLIAAGYRPQDRKRGFAVVADMSNGKRRFSLTSKPEMEYARERAAAVPA